MVASMNSRQGWLQSLLLFCIDDDSFVDLFKSGLESLLSFSKAA